MQQRSAGPSSGRYVLRGCGRSTEASRPFGVSGIGFPGTPIFGAPIARSAFVDPPRRPVQLQLPLLAGEDVSIRNTCSDLACRIGTEGSYYKRSLAKYTFLEFFAGAGLVRAGLEPDWRCLWANDIDTSKQRIYEANFGKGDFHPGDVADVKASELPAADMAWASFPCQDLSLAGWQRGMSAEQSGTFWPFWSLMRDRFDVGKRPPIIVLENVTGLLYGDNFTGRIGRILAMPK